MGSVNEQQYPIDKSVEGLLQRQALYAFLQLSKKEIYILETLLLMQLATSQDISIESGIPYSSLTRAIKRLERRQLVKRIYPLWQAAPMLQQTISFTPESEYNVLFSYDPSIGVEIKTISSWK
jgi:hypothetical protein